MLLATRNLTSNEMLCLPYLVIPLPQTITSEWPATDVKSQSQSTLLHKTSSTASIQLPLSRTPAPPPPPPPQAPLLPLHLQCAVVPVINLIMEQ